MESDDVKILKEQIILRDKLILSLEAELAKVYRQLRETRSEAKKLILKLQEGLKTSVFRKYELLEVMTRNPEVD